MQEFSLEHLRCIKCAGDLEIQVLRRSSEVDEGFLFCKKCVLYFPIIDRVAIMRDLVRHLSNRPSLGGELLSAANTPQMKSFVKKSLSKIGRVAEDVSVIEKRWAGIYDKNRRSSFYSKMKKSLDSVPGDVALEHGCSVGIVTKHLAKDRSTVFGIDRSYYGVLMAKRHAQANLDYFVADSLEQPFGRIKFDVVVGLNIFELIEPKILLKSLARQVKRNGFLVLSDPYDYERGSKSVREPLFEDSVRSELAKCGFSISNDTKRPSHVRWNLQLYDRAVLQYKVDLVIGKMRTSKNLAP